jgi:hypothetical protein
MTNTEEWLHNWRPIKQGVRMGDGNVLEATNCGSVTASWKDPETGRETQFELKQVKYVPGLWRNLFSVKSALKEGATLKSKGECMMVEKGKVNLKFCETNESGLLTANFKIKVDHALSSQEMKEDMMTFHKKLGHPCKDLIKKTANYLGITLTGSWTECRECLMGKAKKKQLKKDSRNKSAKGGERLGFDISYLKNSSFGGSKFWLLIVDEATSMVWSYFLRRKSETEKKDVGVHHDHESPGSGHGKISQA